MLGVNPARATDRAGTEASAGRSLGRRAEKISGRRGGRRARHQPDQFRLLRRSGRRDRRHDPHLRHHAREALESSERGSEGGEKVRAMVLEVDKERRRIKLGIKQLEPTSVDEYMAEHQVGESVSGRIVERPGRAKVELGEGVFAECRMPRRSGERIEPAGARAEGRFVVANGDAFSEMETGSRRHRRRGRNRRARDRSAASAS